MWTSASIFFLLTTFVGGTSIWYEGFDEKECRSDGACRCKDLTDDSIFLDWTKGIESCTCLKNKIGFENNEGLKGCTPKCRSDGWYAVEQLCDGSYLCVNKEGDLYEDSVTEDKDKLDCSMYGDDDGGDSDGGSGDSDDGNGDSDGGSSGSEDDSTVINKMKKIIRKFIHNIIKVLY